MTARETILFEEGTLQEARTRLLSHHEFSAIKSAIAIDVADFVFVFMKPEEKGYEQLESSYE